MSVSKKPGLVPKKAGVILASPEDSIEYCLDTMANAKIGSLLIVRDGKILGILTERDLLRLWRQLGDPTFCTKPVSTVMSHPVFSMNASQLSSAPKEMIERKIRHIPLTDDDGEILGVISMRDILHAQVRAKKTPRLKAVISAPEIHGAQSTTVPAKSATISFMHVLTPHPQLIEVCRQALPENWVLRIWTDINALQNAPEIKDGERRERTAFVVDLDGFVKSDWKKLIRRFIEFLRSEKQPEVFLIWSPHLIDEADVSSLQTVAEKANWHAYLRPLPISVLTADIREMGDGSYEEEEEEQ